LNGTRGRCFAVIAFLMLTTLAIGADDCAVGKVVGVKRTIKGQPNILAVKGEDFGSGGKDKEVPADALDGDLNTKYYNQARSGTQRAGVYTGLVVTLKDGPKVVTGIQFGTANDVPGRDPVKITIEGSNDAKALEAGTSTFTLLYEGGSGVEIDPGRNKWGKEVNFPNNKAYASYRVLVAGLRDETGKDAEVNSTQYSEIKFITGTPATGSSATSKSASTPPDSVPSPAAVVSTTPSSRKEVYLTVQRASRVKMGWGKAGDNLNVNGNALCIGKQVFGKGIGLNANSEIIFKLEPDVRWVTFHAGIDSDLTDSGALRVNVYVDGQVIYESSTMRFGEDPIYVSREIKKKDARELRIEVVVAPDGTGKDLLDFGNLRFSKSTTEPTRDAAAAVKE
jgi:hypothetical protein